MCKGIIIDIIAIGRRVITAQENLPTFTPGGRNDS